MTCLVVRLRVGLLGLMLAGSGCPADDVEGEGGGEGGGTEGSGSASDPTNGSAGTDSPSDCTEYASVADIGPAVLLRVQNDRTDPIWVNAAGCGGSARFGIVDPMGDPVSWLTPGCSPYFCDDFLGQSDCSVGCDDCEPPSLVRLDPGVSVEANWTGVSMTPLTVSPACADGENCQTNCMRRDQAPGGNYQLELEIYAACTGTCECEAGAPAGACGLFGATPDGTPETVSVGFSYPTDNEVELLVE